MRVSPAAFLNRRRTLAEALAAADRVTRITHDHPEGMKGARATTHAIWLAFQGEAPRSIAAAIAETYGYDLSRDVATIRETYEYNETCQRTVPEAMVCGLEAADFERAIRNAVSLGGDADTLAAIARPVAEALYGIPADPTAPMPAAGGAMPTWWRPALLSRLGHVTGSARVSPVSVPRNLQW